MTDSPQVWVLGARGALGVGVGPGRLRAAFGAFPSGVVAVVARVGGRVVGLVASSFTSVSFEPPLVSFSIRPRGLAVR
ncbi:flavin reductase like protein [Actinokineospora cianjurensis]|uniref:Flavin reductase like protein n=1 Tax=Actinokineospora cianjurensis TaxID=585224 RepID=A0A421B4V5_9PSEU|nr:flavin reductase like protein [Actinokineospora cianjurensis]